MLLQIVARKLKLQSLTALRTISTLLHFNHLQNAKSIPFAYNNLGICLLFRGELDRITTILDLLNFKSFENTVVIHRRQVQY